MRGIALDAINQAGQGHLGMALGAAPITFALIAKHLKFDRHDPTWIDRDRLVLSAGHGSMAQYSIMHFMGLLPLSAMRRHKQWASQTPSHPEIDRFAFVDATTGPLGQGIAMAVGMAISEKQLAQRYNTAQLTVIDHQIFAIHGDGCLQEGVALEAIQLAGTMRLDNLILIHDFNNMQIDSATSQVNNLDLRAYFAAQNFATFIVLDPTVAKIEQALAAARLAKKPSYVQIQTKIAYGTEYENTPQGHNGTLSVAATLAYKQKIGLKSPVPFQYEQAIYDQAATYWSPKMVARQKWDQRMAQLKVQNKAQYDALLTLQDPPQNYFQGFKLQSKNVATRNYLGALIAHLDATNVRIVGGSADLAKATKVQFKTDIFAGGKNIHYGIREFAMAAINNGIYLHARTKTIDGTFLVFADYMKAAIRLGAIQKIPAIHIFTHDSYQVGGDGPTHQPFDQLAMLRAMANVLVIRPCDGSEMQLALNYALNIHDQQICIIGCRQPLKSFDLITDRMAPAYHIYQTSDFEISLLASGSEVQLAYEVAELLAKNAIKAQVISVPILQQLVENKRLISELGIDQQPIFAIEASSDSSWYKLAQYNRFAMLQATQYGASAPGPEVYAKRGFEKQHIVTLIKKFLQQPS